MALTRQRYTFDEWLASAENAALTELVDGVPVERMGTTSDHGRVTRALQHWLERAEAGGYGSVHLGPETVLLDANGARRNARAPDVFFLSAERDALDTGRAIEGLPDLVIEVLSPTTRTDDLPGGDKWRDYERFGAPSYWIVDPEMRTLTQYMHRGDRYDAPTTLREADTARFALFPDIALRVAELFRGLRSSGWQR